MSPIVFRETKWIKTGENNLYENTYKKTQDKFRRNFGCLQITKSQDTTWTSPRGKLQDALLSPDCTNIN